MDAHSPRTSARAQRSPPRRRSHRAGLRGTEFLRHRPRPARPAPAYLPPDDFRQLEPHFDRLGALAGGRLDELARIADKHPPVLHPRDRFGRDEDCIDYHALLPRDGEHRVRRFPVSRHEPSRRRARHGPPAAGGGQIRAAISVRAGRVRADVPDQRHRHLDPPDPKIRRAPSCRIICCRKCCPATSPRCGRARSS